MITGLVAIATADSSIVDSNDLIRVDVTGTFEAPGETDTIDVFSLQTRGCELSRREHGPYLGSSLALVLPPADGANQSVRRFWIRAGDVTGLERIMIRARAVPTVESEVVIDMLPKREEKTIEEYAGDAVLSGVTDFFRFFRDTDLLRGAWDGMAKDADDLDARTTVVDKSARIFEMPILTSKRWQGYDFDDSTGVHDSQVVTFAPVEGGDYGFSNDAEDSGNRAYWNSSNDFGAVLAAEPNAFIIMGGTSELNSSERLEIDEADGSVWSKSSNVDGQGPCLQQDYTVGVPLVSITSIELTLKARGYGSVGQSTAVVAEVWNFARRRWEEIGRQLTPASSQIGLGYTDLGTVLFGEDLFEYVSGLGKVTTRVRSDQASNGPLQPVTIDVDHAHAWVGVTGRSGVQLVSPAGTTISRDLTKFTAHALESEEEYDENVDFFVDYDRGRIIWLRRVESSFQVRVIFHDDFQYVYSVDDDLIGLPELRQTVLIEQSKRLRDGQDFIVIEPGKIRTAKKQHYAGRRRKWWSEVSLHDEERIFRNFGILTERFTDERSSLLYLRRVQALWYAFWSGPSIFNVQAGAQILMNAPFAFTRTRVAELSTDEESSLPPNTARLENGQIVTKPPSSDWVVQTGQEVAQYQPLSSGLRVADKVSEPGFATENDDTSAFVADQLIVDPDVTGQKKLAQVMAEGHLFTAEVDGFILGQSGADVTVVEKFIRSIKPVHTEGTVTIVLGGDCGEIVEGPCGPEFDDDGNCFCDIVGAIYDECPTFFTFVELDVSQYLARRPYSSRARQTQVNDVADLAGIPNPKHGDWVSVVNEGISYVYYAPQEFYSSTPLIDFGVYYDEDDESWRSIVPNLHPGYPLETWSSAPLVEVEAGTHDDPTQPPFDQWQWGGRWVPSQGRDLPTLSSHKSDMDLNKSPDAGRSNNDYFGTAFNHLGAGIGGSNSTRHEETDARTVQAAAPYGLVGGPLSNTPVVSVRRAWKRVDSGTGDVSSTATSLVDLTQTFLSTVQVGDVVRNITEGTYAWVETVVSDTELTTTNDDPESPGAVPLQSADPVTDWPSDSYQVVRRIPNHEFTFDQSGNVFFDAVHAGQTVDFTYLEGHPITDDPGGAAPASQQYEDRAESEMPATIGRNWSNYDETFDLDDDTVGVTTYALQIYRTLLDASGNPVGGTVHVETLRSKDNGDGAGFDFDDVDYTTVHGFFPP